MQDVFRANLSPALLRNEALFSEEDPFTKHVNLSEGMLQLRGEIGRPAIRNELKVLLEFHSIKRDTAWVAGHAAKLKTLLSRVVRTQRQMKTGERLSEGMLRLTNILKTLGTAASQSKTTVGVIRLLKRRSSVSSEPAEGPKPSTTTDGPPSKHHCDDSRTGILNAHRVSSDVRSVSSTSSDVEEIVPPAFSKGPYVFRCWQGHGCALP